MKPNQILKVAAIAAMLFSPVTMMGQRVILDKVGEEGQRLVSTGVEVLVRDFSSRYAFSLAVYASKFPSIDRLRYELVLGIGSGSAVIVSPDALFMLKLGDDSVMELRRISQTDDPIGTYDAMTKTRMHLTHVYYGIEEEQLTEIASKGVKKVRIELSHKVVDKDLSNDKFKKIVASHYKVVKERIEQNKTIRDDF